jgi:hypothetical protein
MFNSRFIRRILRNWSAKSSTTFPTPESGCHPSRKFEQMAGAFDDMKDLQRYPLTGEKREDGLLLHFSDGTIKFVPDWTPPLSEPEGDGTST